jgi:signal recognition particle subunit SRP54
VLSMTPQERALPQIIDGRRRQRIARGSGTTVQQVNQLLEARKQMERMLQGMNKGKLPSFDALQAGAGNGAPAGRSSPRKSKKKKKKAKGRR